MTATQAPDRSTGPDPAGGPPRAGDRPDLVTPGAFDTLGATPTGDGVTFCVYSRRATGLDLLLFDRVDDAAPARVIHLDRAADRTADYWHIRVPGVAPGQLYAYAADGPWSPHDGLRFDPSQVLLDPYGRAVATPPGYRRLPAGAQGDPATAMKSVVVDPSTYDWEGDRPLGHSWRPTIVYETHLRGFTADPSSGVAPERRPTRRIAQRGSAAYRSATARAVAATRARTSGGSSTSTHRPAPSSTPATSSGQSIRSRSRSQPSGSGSVRDSAALTTA